MKTHLENLLCGFPELYSILEAKRQLPDDEKRVYLTLAERGFNIIEAGANLGHYTRLLSRIVGSKGKVIAFEPVENTYQHLSESCKTAALPCTPELLQLGISDVEQKLTIYTPGDDHGQSSLRQHDSGSWKSSSEVHSQEIKVVRLDDIITERNTTIDFMKLDLEGAELLALHGAEKVIAKQCPILHVEVSDHWLDSFGHTPEQVTDFLMSKGNYDTWWGYGEGLPQPQPIQNIADLTKPRSFNLICLKKEKHGRTLSRLEKTFR